MILAADRCRSRAPSIYVAESVTEIEEILNPKLGDVALFISPGTFSVFTLGESETEPDGVNILESNTCEYVWIRSQTDSGSVESVVTFGADPTGVEDSTDAINDALLSASGDVLFPPGIYRISDNLELARSHFSIYGMGARVIQHTAGKDGIGNYTNTVLRRINIVGLQVNCAANIIGNAGFHLKNVSESTLFMIKTSMESNFNTDGFMYGVKFYGESAIGNGCLYNEVNQCSILTHRHANSVGIDSNADTPGYGANSCVVLGGTIQALDGTGIRIDQCNNFVCLGAKCEGANLNSGYGIRIASTFGGNVILGCRFEDLNVNIVLGVGSNRNVIAFNNHNSAATSVIQDFGTARSNTIIEPDADGEKFNRIQLKDLDVFGADTSGATDHTVFRGGVITTRYWDLVAKGFNAVTAGYDLEITNPTFKGDILLNPINSGLVRTGTLAPLTSAGALIMQDGFVRFQRSAAGSAIWTGYTSGENNSRVSVFNTGEFRFSDGTAADDVGFIRIAAGVFKITDAGAGLGTLRAGGVNVTLQSFANNAAALAGGLVANDLYQVTATDPRQVAIVF